MNKVEKKTWTLAGVESYDFKVVNDEYVKVLEGAFKAATDFINNLDSSQWSDEEIKYYDAFLAAKVDL